MLKDLTQQYINRFDQKDLDDIAALLTNDFALGDPVVRRIEGKSKVLEAIKKIFASC